MEARDAIVNGNRLVADQSLTDGTISERNHALPEITEISDQDYKVETAPPLVLMESWR